MKFIKKLEKMCNIFTGILCPLMTCKGGKFVLLMSEKKSSLLGKHEQKVKVRGKGVKGEKCDEG